MIAFHVALYLFKSLTITNAEYTASTSAYMAPTGFEEVAVYKECRHNHVASLNRVSYDGCHEFIERNNGEEALLCDACGCHRNFHRKQTIYIPIMPLNTVKPKRKKRTVFTAEQRDRMTRFAETLGWRVQKGKSDEIERFCMEMGMSRRMFIVWLNNNRRRSNDH
ncbi:hypothetical protein RJT34_13237 [Clitoria ternatea]|uniref:ZF-HD dimerization-type domain-containing protein n=1 Tax=Clitoria ternatea TaxID=43366 RepID=A0AAN9JN85_CLITE